MAQTARKKTCAAASLTAIYTVATAAIVLPFSFWVTCLTNNYVFDATASLPQQYPSGQIKPLYELGKLQDAKPQPRQDVAEDPPGQQYEL